MSGVEGRRREAHRREAHRREADRREAQRRTRREASDSDESVSDSLAPHNSSRRESRQREFSVVLGTAKRRADESPGSHRTREPPERQPSGSLGRDQSDLGRHHTGRTSGISAPAVPDDFIINPANQSRYSFSEAPVAAALNNRRSQTNPATAAPEEVNRQASILQTSISGRRRHDEQSSPIRDAPQSSFTSSRFPNPVSSTARHVAGHYQPYEPTTRNSARSPGEQIHGRSALDSRYSVRKNNFFHFGRVFSVVWHESAPGQDTSVSLIRRMVVVKQFANFCWCIPINSYGGQGLRKRGMTRQEVAAHAIIHMTGQQPTILPEEQSMKKMPLEVAPSDSDQKLAPSSRLNFAKVYTVESFHKVAEVGRVTPNSLRQLREYWQEQTEED